MNFGGYTNILSVKININIYSGKSVGNWLFLHLVGNKIWLKSSSKCVLNSTSSFLLSTSHLLLNFSIQVQWVIKVKGVRQNKPNRQMWRSLRRKRKPHKWLCNQVQINKCVSRRGEGSEVCTYCYEAQECAVMIYNPRDTIHIHLWSEQPIVSADILLGAITMRAENW